VNAEAQRFCPTCGRRGISAFCSTDGTEMKSLVAGGAVFPAPATASTPNVGSTPTQVFLPPLASRSPSTRLRRTLLIAAAVTAVVVAAVLYGSWSSSQQPTGQRPPDPTRYGITAELKVSCSTSITRTGDQGRNVAFCVSRSSVPLDRVDRLEIGMTDTSDLYGGSQTRSTVCQDGIPVGVDSYCGLVFWYSCSGTPHTYDVQAKLYGANDQAGTWVDASYVALSASVSC